ncbi:hypothetical protein LRP50_00500 [Enterovibrio sp. ZSDZ42]|uniref:Uncharacterized protein n=1 Tax=Enterovibrio gelatinilyticus TaxID=2899819 RepID=A0ABT5QWC3_9GAMM|nr:hypothetical protein [Enterovibrio sp. ZSDZ42]MDD1791607.1 hypothetical protein [Enterovibrio sp. ZSDZ42]
MDSQLYLVVNQIQCLGQQVSKRLAEKGNVVVYLDDDEQEGYRLAAEEPRIRYRYCQPKDENMILSEVEWTQRCVSSIDGIVAMVSAAEVQGIRMPLEDHSLFSSVVLKESVQTLPLTYVIVSNDDTQTESLKAIHLALCAQSHLYEKPSALRVNYVVISTKADEKLMESSVFSDISTDVSNLIHYLTSSHARAIYRQAFYIENLRDK